MFSPSPFRRAMGRGLGAEALGQTLTAGFYEGLPLRRAMAGELGEPEEVRDRAAEIRDRSLDNLEGLLLGLEARVRAAGGQVHWASNAAEANGYILDIAKENRVKTVVKGKSMTTEELGLNPVLEHAGIEVWETDLGEFIVQLAGERPFHIVGPAKHKTVAQVAELFRRRLGTGRLSQPEDLTRAARLFLRQRFLSADMGVSGANFAAAATGTLAVIENEGNIRLSTTLPRVHVAIMGIEKVVADMAELEYLLNLLPRWALGLRLTAYASLLTGAARAGEEGPQAFHLVLLDNYRARVWGSPYRQILRCIRCGVCHYACPVFRNIGGHAYPWVYNGPMGVVLTALSQGPPGRWRELLGACTHCGNCNEHCPVRIDLSGMIARLGAEAAAPPVKVAAAVTGTLAATAGGYAAARAGLGIYEAVNAPAQAEISMPGAAFGGPRRRLIRRAKRSFKQAFGLQGRGEK